MFRHTAATNWVRAGVDLDVVQRLLGHASLASTAVYLHAADEDKRRAVEAVAAGSATGEHIGVAPRVGAEPTGGWWRRRLAGMAVCPYRKRVAAR